MFYELTDLLLQKTPEEIAKENKPPLCRPRHRTCCEQSRELIWDTFEKPETSFLGLFSTPGFRAYFSMDQFLRGIIFFGVTKFFDGSNISNFSRRSTVRINRSFFLNNEMCR